ncbi:signal peptide peptidase SppA, 67K type [Chloroherpeton thalassium ATCC 35110]|uniref:Signal peptide peptidase SppA, 67K type n=1 Tax=Chloroherpeton thalassium (strain ATCC 35110 / GB-78) TaxID=517418 RepID=B3QS80_CHLT3|nr:signal peptide peptidase SppA [Chloroherpeton thalassium]ACF14025.1 signal peptide peptidase SppA, 67K type [Chloroherpeton thalassium ATCC 35110]
MSENKHSRGRKIFLTILVLVFILIGIGVYRVLSPSVAIPEQSVLMLDVQGELPEVREDEEFPLFAEAQPLALQELLVTLKKASVDDRIDLIVVRIQSLSTQMAKLDELRQAIADYRKSGKEIWAFLSFPGDSEYLLASACNHIYLEKHSMMMLDGLKSERLYFRTPLEKMGVKVQVAKRENYKSAAEPLLRDAPSAFDLEQRNALLDDFYESYVNAVAASRQMSRAAYERVINDIAFVSDKEASELGLVDSVIFFRDLKRQLIAKYEVKASDKDDFFVSGETYRGVDLESLHLDGGEKIAVINLTGVIEGEMSSASSDGKGGTAALLQSIEAVGKDESIKAMILRVDSPGGSGLASDKILSELILAQKQKPLVVSMSGTAASGGYWVSLNANKIVAGENTVTGSIGVLAAKPYIKELQEKIGLERNVLVRGKFADAFNFFDELSPETYAKFDRFIGDFYEEFVEKVAEGRNMTPEAVRKIAQGRVWTGKRAKEIGLVDELGGLQTAVEVAKSLAGIDSASMVTLVRYPRPKTFWSTIWEDESLARVSAMFVAAIKKDLYRELSLQLGLSRDALQTFGQFEHVRKILANAMALQPQTVLPYEIIVQ